jgi:predicted glycosyltransferase
MSAGPLQWRASCRTVNECGVLRAQKFLQLRLVTALTRESLNVQHLDACCVDQCPSTAQSSLEVQAG